MIYLSLTLTLLSIIFYKNILKRKTFAVISASLILLSLLSIITYFIINNLTGDGINESVIYHLKMEMGGAGISEFSSLIIISGLLIALACLIALIAYRISLVKVITRDKKNSFRKWIAPLALLSAFILNPAIRESLDLYYLSFQSQKNIEIPDQYIVPKIVKDPTIPYKNLVYLYLESFEATYLNEDLFPDLTPNLNKLQKKAINFSDIRQVYGSGWTIAGMVNTQCGIPLVTPSGGNSMGSIDLFLPEATCIGDILNQYGYDLNYIGGADLNFAGKGNFYKTHGFHKISGLQELRDKQIDNSYLSGWGIYDDTLYDFVKDSYDQLSEKNRPFALFSLNLDTHHPTGHESRYCNNKRYKNGDNPILNAIHCTDKIIAEVIDHIESSSSYDNTIIVISSDHLAMPNTAFDLLKQGDRKNLFMILGKDIKPLEVATQGALIDTAPTILDIMGFPITELAFGRSLLSNSTTLSESLNINEFLKEHRGFASNLWAFPSLHRGVYIDAEQGIARLNGRNIKYPFALTFNELLETDKIYFNGVPKISEIMIQTDPNQNFFWLDSCSTLNILDVQHSQQNTDYCLAIGSFLDRNIEIIPIPQNTKLSNKEIKKILQNSIKDAQMPEKYHEKLKYFHKYGNADIYPLSLDKDLPYTIRSNGGFKEQSLISNNKDHNNKINTHRGLTMIGINQDQSPQIIKHVDTCSLSQQEIIDLNYSFQDDIERYSGQYEVFIINTHDSAICGNKNLEPLFEKTELTEWQNIGFRTPYIAIITSESKYEFFKTNAETSIVVEIE